MENQKEMKVISVNLSEEQGPKQSYKKILAEKPGIRGDVHAGTVRPVSLVDVSHAKRLSELTGARLLEPGELAENITVSGMEEVDFQPFDLLKIGDEVVLEVIQKGKPFHNQFREAGNYVMPREGIFCRVLQEGVMAQGDTIEYYPKEFRVMIITLSDRAKQGVYEDLSGPAIKEHIERFFEKTGWRLRIDTGIIPDDIKEFSGVLDLAKNNRTDILFTTGGTGIGPRDITVDVVKTYLDAEIPGIMEMIRMKYGKEKPNALLSRSVAGTMNETLVYTLPGSVRAVNEYMTEILKTLKHAILMFHGIDAH